MALSDTCAQLAIDECVLEAIENSRMRGCTCHEIADLLKETPRSIGRSLVRLRGYLVHLNNERDGQRVFVMADRNE